MSHRPPARSVYLAMSAAYAFCFALITTVNLIYQATTVGLSAFELVLVGTVLEAVCLTFEIPTAVVADTYSRKLSIVIGIALIGVGFTVEGTVQTLAGVLAGNVLFGIGATFCSGAEQAWVNDELGEVGAASAMVRGARLGNLAGLAAIPVSVGVAQWGISLPVVVGGLGLVLLAVALALAMPERGFKPVPAAERETWASMRATLADGFSQVQARPRLRGVIMIGVAFGAFSEGFDRLSVAHILRDVGTPEAGDLRPVVWLGALFAVESLLAIAVLGRVAVRLEHEGPDHAAPMLAIVYPLLSAATAVFALARGFGPAAAAAVGAGAARELQSPLYQVVLNAGLASRSRATVNSFAAQADAGGQIVGGLAIGAIAGAVSIPAGLLVAAVLLLAAPLLLRRAVRDPVA